MLRYNHNLVFALPPHMGQASPSTHGLFLPAPTGFSGKEGPVPLGMHAGSFEALRVTRPEAAGLGRN